jgi:hypothetical protein
VGEQFPSYSQAGSSRPEASLGIPLEPLERLVQEAHESTPKQMHDPQERFPVTRQALRMFWHFRCNLEAVMPKEDRT